ncbi:MAG: NAD-dependent epimerase/dehydratase family protein, partial [Candidatus Binataceae bacterium]
MEELSLEDEQKVLVTGYAGYIGSVLVPMLIREGFSLVGLDTFFFEQAGLPALKPAIPQIHKDVRDVTVKDLKGVDSIVHLAALSNDPMGNLQPELT